MKIRLHGTEDECLKVAERLAGVVEVLAVSAPYPDREGVGARPRVRQGADRAARARHQHH